MHDNAFKIFKEVSRRPRIAGAPESGNLAPQFTPAI